MIAEKLKELKIEIPNAPDPVGAYVAFKKIGNLLFITSSSTRWTPLSHASVIW